MDSPAELRYFNENDGFASEWLSNLFPGARIDPRSIAAVRGTDLQGVQRAHFFAGIGGWEYALDLAGWPAGVPVWTGSCPCQPFSAAGKRKAEKDERHLWPEFRRLIAECRPSVVFGEQVASRLGREWLAGVFADLEGLGYAVAGADLCAAGVGAPHIRQRLYWVAYAPNADRGTGERRAETGTGAHQEWGRGPSGGGIAVGLGHAGGQGLPERGSDGRVQREAVGASSGQGAVGASHWAHADWLQCLDGKARRVEPSIFPLAHGVPARVGRLRAYGNAIVPQVAAVFVRAAMDSLGIARG